MGKRNIIEVSTVDILEGLVANTARKIKIKSVEVLPEGLFKLEVDNVYFLIPVCTYEIDGNNYKVIEIDGCNSVTVKGKKGSEPEPPSGIEFDLPAPFFWHGTVRLTSAEWDQVKKENKIFPAVYALEPILDKFDNDPVSLFDRVSSFTLFAITTVDKNDWFTDEHYLNAINPLRRWIKEFKGELEKPNSGIGKFDSFDIINRANLGVLKKNQGNTANLTNYQVSGCEFSASLPIKIDLSCKFACKC